MIGNFCETIVRRKGSGLAIIHAAVPLHQRRLTVACVRQNGSGSRPAHRLREFPLRASSECWFIWSISSIWFGWLIGLEIYPEEPDRPERPANQTDEPKRVARAQKINQPPSHSHLQDGLGATKTRTLRRWSV